MRVFACVDVGRQAGRQLNERAQWPDTVISRTHTHSPAYTHTLSPAYTHTNQCCRALFAVYHPYTCAQPHCQRTTTHTVFVSSLFIAGIFGAFIGSGVSKHWGRRPAMMLAGEE